MKKKIKSIFIFVAVITVIFCFSATVSASNMYANIESAFTKIDIPDNFTVTSAVVQTETNPVYEANAEAADTNKTLCITSEKNDKSQDIFNFKYLSKDEITKELTDLKSGSSYLTGKSFNNVTNAAFKEKKDCIEFYFYNSEIIDNLTINNAVTYTVINGELITVTYSSKSGAFTAEEKEMFNNITDSITVDKLCTKPKSIDIGKIFGTVLTIAIFVFFVIMALLVVYYFRNKNTRSKSSSKLADKYYDELKNEGLMDENQQMSANNKKLKSSEGRRPSFNLPENGISSAINSWRQPSLIEDEWEDMDIEKMFVLPNKIESDALKPLDDGHGPLTNGPTEFIHGDGTLKTYETETVIEDYNNTNVENVYNDIEDMPQMSRSDSAKRFVKMFIGSEVEHKDFDEKNSSEYKAENRKSTSSKHSTSRRSTSARRKKTATAKAKSGDTRSSRRRQSQIINDFELDSYWDKYR